MKFLIIFGPPAVGKMTVGFEIAKLTGFKVFHNHLTIELLLNFFEYESAEFKKLNREFRRMLFEEIAKSDLPGLIFTYVWAFDIADDSEYVEEVCEIFRRENAEIYFAELEADEEIRLERNKTELRLEHKPSKRNLKRSEDGLLRLSREHKLNSDGETFGENYIKMNNSDLCAKDTAERIIKRFNFKIINWKMESYVKIPETLFEKIR